MVTGAHQTDKTSLLTTLFPKLPLIALDVPSLAVKTPKLYFRDTGLLCHLLGLSDPAALLDSIVIGSVWETFVLNQILLTIEWASTAATVWFWRDAHGLEVDLMVDLGNRFELVECKWTESPDRRDVAALDKIGTLVGRNRKVGLRLACRTPHPFAVTDEVTAINGFAERDWLRRQS